MVDLVLSSRDLHSWTDIEASRALCRMASICRLIINTPWIISFYKVKFFPSNFQISTLVLDRVTIFLEVDAFGSVFFFQQVGFFSLVFYCSLPLDNKVSLIPLIVVMMMMCSGRWGPVKCVQQSTQILNWLWRFMQDEQEARSTFKL